LGFQGQLVEVHLSFQAGSGVTPRPWPLHTVFAWLNGFRRQREAGAVTVRARLGSGPGRVGNGRRSSGPRRYRPRPLVEHEVAPVLLVDVPNLLAHLALEPLEALVRLAQLVLEPQHHLDAGEIEPELGGQTLDQPQTLEIRLRVETGVPARPPRVDQPLVL